MDPAEDRELPSPRGIDRWLKRLGKSLSDDASRRELRQGISRWVRSGIGLGAFGYAAVLLMLIVSFRWIGEKNLTLAFLLYLPRNAFLIPSLLLFLPAILWHRLSALALLTGSVFFVFLGLDFRAGKAPAPNPSTPGNSVTVLTYNRGQHMNQSLRPFKAHTKPDLILLQEACGRAAGYLKAEGYEEFPHAVDVGEFTLLSRYPILDAEPVILRAGEASPPIAARFTIDFDGTEIAVYSIHTISPRDTLKYYRRGAFLYGIIGVPGTAFAKKRRANQAYWDARVEEARLLRDYIEADPLPAIIAGDFNAPAGGYIHQLFRSRFHDAHATVGHGFGYTFPGTTRNPLSRGGPWMRIDYLFCNEAWEPVWCVTESDRPSQHRAVSAQFKIK